MDKKRISKFAAGVVGILILAAGIGVASRPFWDSTTSGLRPDKTSEPQLMILTIGTADSGGTMYPVGSAIAQALTAKEPFLKVNTSASSGSLANVQGIENGQIDMGLVSADVALVAYEGKAEFSGKPVENLRVIAAVYSSLSNWMVRENADIVYVHDLIGKRVALGPEGSTTELSARNALTVLGINKNNTQFLNYGLGTAGTAVMENDVDAVHGFAGIPINGLEEMAQKTPTRLLQYTDEELHKILARNASYSRSIIPAGTYTGQTQPVETFGVKCLLCVSADMDEELVYTITKALYDSVEEMAAEQPVMAEMKKEDFCYSNLPVPLHPGAEKFYRERGLVQD
ncbi:TAXI family TRAP transporter solute-binding subunit [Pygmaiobacter massiliensis]|uniref:TAXI family TRAP transporter solute-binding subunit n=1 Tax=Pygmaiobacter massiliensis TaxID=1917873 RepID=UPI000C7E02E0|nr:TAXI family TRAP transporter solute-binding subunit [Pygmaiobacter massiliensis]MDY4783533.1 TAXI family TRAP transporter solute-binding subunit [Pygmaiobacter massiliensis]